MVDISIIIPAYNEENVISRCIESILEGSLNDELEIIVSCNGCNDNTVQIAKKFEPHVQVIEIPIASKVNALNAADNLASAPIRLYIDADITINIDSIRRMAKALKNKEGLVAYPELEMDLKLTNWIVRAYYNVWMNLPYNTVGVGTGMYALSYKGRKRFNYFPDVIADDGYIRSIFNENERIRVNNAFSNVRPPENFTGLVKIKTRSRLGQYQLKLLFPDLKTTDDKSKNALLSLFFKSPKLWLWLPVYLYINLYSRIRARNQYNQLDDFHWEKDDSSRKVK